MAKPTIKTLSPELLREIRWTIDQVHRLTRGNLRDEDRTPPKAPDDYMVRTPPSGIPGRTNARINAVICDVYREEEIIPGVWGGQKGLVRITDGYGNPYQLPIYNIYCEPVPGDLLVPTALLKSGTRYVSNWFDCGSSSSSSDSSSDSSDSSGSSSSDDSSDSSSDDSSSDSTSDSTSASASDSGSDQPPSDSGSEAPCPCNGTCLYSGGSGVWYLLEDDTTCATPCYCEPPSEPPDYTGQIAEGTCWGPCDESSDSGSDEPPNDSSDDTFSDSSQSVGDCGGECMWTWYASMGWTGAMNYCLPPMEPCVCTYPTVSGEYEGQTIYTPCGNML